MPAALHKKPICHPERRYKAHDLCPQCYKLHWDTVNREKMLGYQRNYKRTHPELGRRSAARAKERRRIWRLIHPRKRLSDDERRDRINLYRAANRDRILAGQRSRYQLNKEKEHERGRLYRLRNRATLRIRGRERYWREHEKSLEWSRRSYHTHREQRRAQHRIYRTDPARRPQRLEQKRRYYYRPEALKVRRLARRQRKVRTWHRYQSKHLSAYYVRKLLCQGTDLKPNDFSPEIVRIARAKLRLLRAARERQHNEKHDRHSRTAR
jgi:hypothetical protein